MASMATTDPSDLTRLMERAAAGDGDGWRELLARYHSRLRRMVALRLDPRLGGRFDPSDVLQETYLEAHAGLVEYLRDPPLPFFLWLRQLAGHRLGRLHRDHLGRKCRDVSREVSLYRGVPGASSAALAERLLGREGRPSEAAARLERKLRLEQALNSMDPTDREVLVLRHFEQLTRAEAARELGISEAAAAKRYLRALERLKAELDAGPGGLEELRP